MKSLFRADSTVSPGGDVLFVLTNALAHVPHDNVGALAAPAALDDSFPWLLYFTGEGFPSFLRSDDGGFSWEAIAGDPLQDVVEYGGAGMTNDGTAVFLADAAVWYTEDGGETWGEMALPGAVSEIVVSDRIYVGGDSGLWSAVPGGFWTQSVTTAVKRLGPGPTAVVAGDRIYRKVGMAWRSISKPDSSVTAVASDGVRIYAGTNSGEMWMRIGNSWAACGALPIADTEHPMVLRIATNSTSVLVATAEYGPYVSTDYCATWSTSGADIEQPDYEASGGVNDDEEAITALYVRHRHWVLAGWAGIWDSADRGATWDQGSVTTPAYVRSITYAADFPTDSRIWYGPKATGIIITEDGGATVDAPSHDLGTGNISNVWASPDPSEPDTVFASGRGELFASYDGGVNWEEFATNLDSPNSLSIIDTPSHLWVLDARGDDSINESWDGGASWTPLDAANALMTPSIAYEAVHFVDADGEDRSCLLGIKTTKVICTEDGGASWDSAYDGGVTTAPVSIQAWPPEAVTRILFGDEDGVHISDDFGDSWTIVNDWDRDGIESIGMAADGTLFLATETGWIYRSFDGGDTWEDLDARADAPVNSINPRPDWEDHQDVLVATQDGGYQLNDAMGTSPTWDRWCDVWRVDNASTLFRCDADTGCPDSTYDATAGMSDVQSMPAGAYAELWVRGTTIRFLGAGTGIEDVGVEIDGVAVGTLSTGTGNVLAEFDGLSDDQHHVLIIGDGTGDVTIDVVEGWRDSDPLDLGSSFRTDRRVLTPTFSGRPGPAR